MSHINVYKQRVGVVRVGGTYNVTTISYTARAISIEIVPATDDVVVGDGVAYFSMPLTINGYVLERVHARVITAGVTGTTDIQIANATLAVDVLSTKLTIDSGETGSDTAAIPAVINLANDNAITDQLWRIDVDAVSTTKPKGLVVTLQFDVP
jgi:hypothetical protein